MPDSENALWCVVELLGHVKLAGRLTEEERFGAKMGRIDIPVDEGFLTQFFGGGSVYRITPVSEEVARDVAKRCYAAPVHSWDYPKLPAPVASEEGDDDPFDDEADD